MNQPNSIRVAVLDDDDLARLGGVSLLSRDLRTSVVFDGASPEELMAWLVQEPIIPEILLLDMEYRSATYPLRALLTRLRDFFSETKVLGLTQYAEPKTLAIAMEYDLAGLLLKSEVSLSLATAVVHGATANFICTHSIKNGLQELGYPVGIETTVQESWRLHPDLTPRLQEVFWLCLVYGMSARMAASQMYVAHNSVERYRNRIYQILSNDWYYDGSSLLPWGHLLHSTQPLDPDDRKTGYWGNEWAFQVMTMPPREPLA